MVQMIEFYPNTTPREMFEEGIMGGSYFGPNAGPNKKMDPAIKDIFIEFHHADIAEILEELNSSQATYIIKLLDSEKTSDVLMELDDDYREKILKNLSIKEIAEEVEELDSDDATDIILELPEEKRKKVISKIVDAESESLTVWTGSISAFIVTSNLSSACLLTRS